MTVFQSLSRSKYGVIHGLEASTWELIKEYGLLTRALPDEDEVEALVFESGSRQRADWTAGSAAEQDRALTAITRGRIFPIGSFIDSLDIDLACVNLLYAPALDYTAEPVSTTQRHGRHSLTAALG